jgi:hypothetical protein
MLRCRCGKPATVKLMHQTGMGIGVVDICATCENEAKQAAMVIVEVTGMSWYNIPPSLRPKGCFDKEDKKEDPT